MKKVIICVLCLCLALTVCPGLAEETESVLARFTFGMSFDDAYTLADELSGQNMLDLTDYGYNYFTITLAAEEYGVTGPFTLSFTDDVLSSIEFRAGYEKPADPSAEPAAIPEDYVSYGALSETLRGLYGEPQYTSQAGTKAECDSRLVLTESTDYWTATGPYGNAYLQQYEQWIVEGPDGEKILIHHCECDADVRESNSFSCDVYTILSANHQNRLVILPL